MARGTETPENTRQIAKLAAVRKLEALMTQAMQSRTRGRLVLEISYCDGIPKAVKSYLEDNTAIGLLEDRE